MLPTAELATLLPERFLQSQSYGEAHELMGINHAIRNVPVERKSVENIPLVDVKIIEL
jgi:hypothetical protein